MGETGLKSAKEAFLLRDVETRASRHSLSPKSKPGEKGQDLEHLCLRADSQTPSALLLLPHHPHLSSPPDLAPRTSVIPQSPHQPVFEVPLLCHLRISRALLPMPAPHPPGGEVPAYRHLPQTLDGVLPLGSTLTPLPKALTSSPCSKTCTAQ